ncbi:MAG TPA: phosphatidylserine decarboxylase [Sedimentisphaerales bacterium]|nr:phosphatidylserine decarboxylase [Sedimentisphaerales bacterium]
MVRVQNGQDTFFRGERQELIVEARHGSIAAMKIPLTRYGLPQVAVFPAIIVGVMAFCQFVMLRYCVGWICGAVWMLQGLLLVLLVWVLSFFRDPERKTPQGDNLLISPADGTITDVEAVEGCQYIEGPAIRISIFLSIFSVHINRSPCAAVVEGTQYKKGQFRDARHKDSSRVNESNDVVMTRLAEPKDRLVVRQISGAVARRIVCGAKKGDSLAAGQRFGMIKFGSRTDLYLPARPNARIIVKPGDKVRAGLDVLARYE